jgi:putative spermidine/putrescine transport system ATP-binding protein/spermidine/putrescine transport system ATP-binding protein
VAAVDAETIGKSYGATAVLDDVSLRFEDGRFTSLLGPSGSGKTTLLRIVAGFVTADHGRILIGGEDVTSVPVWKRAIGMVFQSYALFPHMSVDDNVAFGLARRGVRGDEARRRVGEALEMVRLSGFGARRPKELSGGQQQRVALARAIVTRPRVLLLDEPLSALDRRLRQEMQVELKRIQREVGITTIFVTHDQEEALALSDHVAILDRGRIVHAGPPGEIYERPATRFAASFLGDANFLEGVVAEGGVIVGGVLVRTDDPLPAPGTKALLAVRPEKIALVPAWGAAPAGHNAVPATVRQVVYAGAASTYLLDGPGGVALTVFAQNRTGGPVAEAGATVTLAFPPKQTILIKD